VTAAVTEATTESTAIRPTGDGLGWMPRLACITAFGLLLVALGNTLSRFSFDGFQLLYYPGLVLVIAPNVIRLLRPEPRRSERIGLVLILGGALYMVKILHDPLAFTFSDEFIQLRNVLDAIASNHLFTRNPLLPTTTYYPGLQAVTASIADVSGLGPFPSGIIVLGAGRLILTLGIYIFFEVAGRSPRLAGLAAVLYMANPNFIFFGAQVAYESLALPLAVMVLLIAAARSGIAAFGDPADRPLRRGLTFMAILAIAAIATTHHVTSIALAGFLTAWSVVAYLTRRRREDGPGPADLAVVAIAAVLIWTLTVASPVIGYLGPVVARAVGNGISLITLQTVPRNLFTSGTGVLAPVWERIASLGSVILVLIGLVFGLIRVWATHRREALVITLALGAMVYPATLILRLTADGAEVANRSSEFLFLAIGFIVVLGVSELWLRGLPSIPRVAVFASAATVMIIGGFLIGWPLWARFPGPFVISADSRSVEAEGLATAQWTLATLGPNNREVADRSQRLIQGTYGHQEAISGYGDTYIDNSANPADSSCPSLPFVNNVVNNCIAVDAKQLIVSPTLGPHERAIAFDGDVHYVVFDRRIFAGLPASGIYVERGELAKNLGPLDLTDPNVALPDGTPAGAPGSGPGPQRAQIANHIGRLYKWDGGPDQPGLPGVDRIYDSGDIQIYDISVWGSSK
jgi:hypothetical protein